MHDVRVVTEPPTRAIAAISGRWVLQILWVVLHSGGMRFTEIQRRIPGISPPMLSGRLRRLEEDGLLTRVQHAGAPPRVEYSPTPLAEQLRPLLDELGRWSRDHFDPPPGG
ncbi:winged helix-turn-helix transcriptional regulator [Actinoplanes rectilineatus]|uniref:winged helix-turn-helix transcriptional regulator n=1 Tax=Actinoplanes rectilineatus TaxID=113571 RepID=UPI0005F2CB23|nr:helix-turn-helix domain-containing protein [Actinoplanes rectilineatus]